MSCSPSRLGLSSPRRWTHGPHDFVFQRISNEALRHQYRTPRISPRSCCSLSSKLPIPDAPSRLFALLQLDLESITYYNGIHRRNQQEDHRLWQQKDLPVRSQQPFRLSYTDPNIQSQIHNSPHAHSPPIPLPRTIPRPAQLLKIRHQRLPLSCLLYQVLQHPLLRKTATCAR
jgi:hypothetical protein